MAAPAWKGSLLGARVPDQHAATLRPFGGRFDEPRGWSPVDRVRALLNDSVTIRLQLTPAPTMPASRREPPSKPPRRFVPHQEALATVPPPRESPQPWDEYLPAPKRVAVGFEAFAATQPSIAAIGPLASASLAARGAIEGAAARASDPGGRSSRYWIVALSAMAAAFTIGLTFGMVLRDLGAVARLSATTGIAAELVE